ncbi:MAG: response regulator [Anaerolineae bacterium]|nr:response regulator [Anaerolineae bacterium]
MNECKVLIADDHVIVREGLIALLNLVDEIMVVGEAADGQEVVEMTERLRPDVVLMDIRMGKPDGVQATREIKTRFPDVIVIVLTNYDDDEYVFDCLRYGASGYLLKDVSPEDLIRAITSAAQGESLVDPAVLNKVLTQFRDLTRDGSDRAEILSAREKEVLEGLAQGLSNKEIARELCITEKTVKAHSSSIYRKLNVTTRSQAIVGAVKNGLVDLGD